ncbi:MAG: agmatinase family protein [Acidimicrobiia bacterium]|nr:agmatinase family protein [Acidimicrobiia bacterium]
MLFDDPSWPRASAWLADASVTAALSVVGVPTAVGSISPSQADTTPAAFRSALGGFSTFDGEAGVDLADLTVVDHGDWDVATLDLDGMHDVVATQAAALPGDTVYAFIGGDNAITRPLVRGLAAGDLERMGVLTFDAHHDVRTLDQGPRNGTPIRGLIDDGLPGSNVVQIGIHSFANSAIYRRFCDDAGIAVHTMEDVDRRGITAVVDDALKRLDSRTDRIYVDFDIDVLDRAYAPACPGSRPGGMHPRQLAAAARSCGIHQKVVAADFVEVDAAQDPGGLTTMQLATTFLAFASGLVAREVA